MLVGPLLRASPQVTKGFAAKITLRDGRGRLLALGGIQSGWYSFRRWQSQDARKPRNARSEPPRITTSDSQPSQGPLIKDKPEPRKGRTLVLCFDGTSNHFKDDKVMSPILPSFGRPHTDRL